MTFAEWLQKQLEQRRWSQIDLLNRMGERRISQAQLSRIITGAREAGLEACIGIADALEIPREEVFRLRGWLPYESSLGEKMQLTPETARLAVEIDELPVDVRQAVWKITQATVSALRETEKKREG